MPISTTGSTNMMDEIGMNTTVVTTNVTTVMTKVMMFRDMTTRLAGRTDMAMARNQTVIIEMAKMMRISLGCNHTPTRARNRYAFERPPGDLSTIPSLVESTNLPFCTSMGIGLHLRSNIVVAAFMSSLMTIIEFSRRVVDELGKMHVIICTGLMSMKHITMLPSVYEMTRMTWPTGARMAMYICVQPPLIEIVDRIASDGVVVVASETWLPVPRSVKSSHRDVVVTVAISPLLCNLLSLVWPVMPTT
jgi:hypothetical protein